MCARACTYVINLYNLNALHLWIYARYLHFNGLFEITQQLTTGVEFHTCTERMWSTICNKRATNRFNWLCIEYAWDTWIDRSRVTKRRSVSQHGRRSGRFRNRSGYVGLRCDETVARTQSNRFQFTSYRTWRHIEELQAFINNSSIFCCRPSFSYVNIWFLFPNVNSSVFVKAVAVFLPF